MLLLYALPGALNFLGSRTRPRVDAPSRGSDSGASRGSACDVGRCRWRILLPTTRTAHVPSLLLFSTVGQEKRLILQNAPSRDLTSDSRACPLSAFDAASDRRRRTATSPCLFDHRAALLDQRPTREEAIR